MIANQRYVTDAVRKAVVKLSKKSNNLLRLYGNYGLVLRGTSSPKTQEIHFASLMQKVEDNMVKAQEQTDIGMAKGLMGQLCEEIIGIISRQYAVDFTAAEKFRSWAKALQFACYIQKRYQYRGDAEKWQCVIRLNNMTDDSVGKLDNNPQTFTQSIANVIRELLTQIKNHLPEDCKYSEEVIDQLAEISSFDGGTAEISAHNYNVNIPKLRRVSMARSIGDIVKKSAPIHEMVI